MEQALVAFGLSPNERKVYKACLELGGNSVTRIAERAGIYRTLTYEILKSLGDKGLMSSVMRDRKKYFEPASPKMLLTILKEKEQIITSALPEMLAMQKSVSVKPSITLYGGKEGVKTVLEMVLREARSFVGVSPKREMTNMLKYYFPKYVERRVQAGISVRLLIDEKPLTTKLLKYRIVKKKFSSVYLIYGNKVLMFSFPLHDPLAIVIENKDFASSMRMMFELAWKGAKD